MKIIAFTAKKETGKTTAVVYMMQKHKNAVCINFKDGLVEEIKELFPELLAQMCFVYGAMDWTLWNVDRLFAEKPPLMRALMRNFGTEVRREQDQDYWVKKWVEKIKQSQDKIIFVDDVRFLNEAGAIRAFGGRIIRIEADKPVPHDLHASEREMDLILPDTVIRNVFGEIETLYTQLDKII